MQFSFTFTFISKVDIEDKRGCGSDNCTDMFFDGKHKTTRQPLYVPRIFIPKSHSTKTTPTLNSGDSSVFQYE